MILFLPLFCDSVDLRLTKCLVRTFRNGDLEVGASRIKGFIGSKLFRKYVISFILCLSLCSSIVIVENWAKYGNIFRLLRQLGSQILERGLP